MKKMLFIIAAALCVHCTFAQITQGKVIYERKLNMHKRLPPDQESMKSMLPEFNTAHQQLVFAGDESIYTTLPEEEDIRDHAGEDGNRMNIRFNTGNSEVYKNYAQLKVMELRELGPKKYIIEDSIKNLAWKLSDDTMQLLGYVCKKAVATSRQGDNVIAWYTEQISSSSGPESFGGLPGLILKMDIGESWMVLTATSIQPNVGKELVKIPSGGKKIARQEFQKMMDDAFGPSTGGPKIRIITHDGDHD